MCSTLFRDTDHAKRLSAVWHPLVAVHDTSAVPAQISASDDSSDADLLEPRYVVKSDLATVAKAGVIDRVFPKRARPHAMIDLTTDDDDDRSDGHAALSQSAKTPETTRSSAKTAGLLSDNPTATSTPETIPRAPSVSAVSPIHASSEDAPSEMSSDFLASPKMDEYLSDIDKRGLPKDTVSETKVSVLFLFLLSRELLKRRRVIDAASRDMSTELNAILTAEAEGQAVPADILLRVGGRFLGDMYDGNRSLYTNNDEATSLLQAATYFHDYISNPHHLNINMQSLRSDQPVQLEVAANLMLVEMILEHVNHIKTVLDFTGDEWDRYLLFQEGDQQTEMAVIDYLKAKLEWYAACAGNVRQYFTAFDNTTDERTQANIHNGIETCNKLSVLVAQCKDVIAQFDRSGDEAQSDHFTVPLSVHWDDGTLVAHATSTRVNEEARMTPGPVDDTLATSWRWRGDSVLEDEQVSHGEQPGSPATIGGMHTASDDLHASRATRGGSGTEMTPGQYPGFAGNDMRAAHSVDTARYGAPFRIFGRSALPETPLRTNDDDLSVSAVHETTGSASHAADGGEIDTIHSPAATMTDRVTIRALPELNLTIDDRVGFPKSVKQMDIDNFVDQVVPEDKRLQFAEIGTFGPAHRADIEIQFFALARATTNKRPVDVQTILDDLNAATRAWVAVKDVATQRVDCYMSVLRMEQSYAVKDSVLVRVVTDSLCKFLPTEFRQQLDERVGEDWLVPLQDALRWHRQSLSNWLTYETQTPRDAFSFGRPWATNGARARFYAGLMHKMTAVMQQYVAEFYEEMLKPIDELSDPLIYKKLLHQKLIRLSESDWTDIGFMTRRPNPKGKIYTSPSLRAIRAVLNLKLGLTENFGDLSVYYSTTVSNRDDPVEIQRALAVDELVKATSCLCTFTWLYGNQISMSGYGSISLQPSSKRETAWSVMQELGKSSPGSTTFGVLSEPMLLPFLESAHTSVRLRVPPATIPPPEIGHIKKTARMFATVASAAETSAQANSPKVYRRIQADRAQEGVHSSAVMEEARLDFIAYDDSDADTFDPCVLLCPAVVFTTTVTLVCDEAKPLVVVLKRERDLLRASPFFGASNAI